MITSDDFDEKFLLNADKLRKNINNKLKTLLDGTNNATAKTLSITLSISDFNDDEDLITIRSNKYITVNGGIEHVKSDLEGRGFNNITFNKYTTKNTTRVINENGEQISEQITYVQPNSVTVTFSF